MLILLYGQTGSVDGRAASAPSGIATLHRTRTTMTRRPAPRVRTAARSEGLVEVLLAGDWAPAYEDDEFIVLRRA